MKDRKTWLEGYLFALGFPFKCNLAEAIVKGRQSIVVTLYGPGDEQRTKPVGTVSLGLEEGTKVGDEAVMFGVAQAVVRQISPQVIPVQPSSMHPMFTSRIVSLLQGALKLPNVAQNVDLGFALNEVVQIALYHLNGHPQMRAVDETTPGFISAPMQRWRDALEAAKRAEPKVVEIKKVYRPEPNDVVMTDTLPGVPLTVLAVEGDEAACSWLDSPDPSTSPVQHEAKFKLAALRPFDHTAFVEEAEQVPAPEPVKAGDQVMAADDPQIMTVDSINADGEAECFWIDPKSLSADQKVWRIVKVDQLVPAEQCGTVPVDTAEIDGVEVSDETAAHLNPRAVRPAKPRLVPSLA